MRYIFGLAALATLVPIFVLSVDAANALSRTLQSGVTAIIDIQIYNTLGVWVIACAALSTAAATITVVERGTVTRPTDDTSRQPQRSSARHEPMPAVAIIVAIVVGIALLAILVTVVSNG